MAGSDNRQRDHQYLVRLTCEEHENISAKADAAGMTPAAFFRLAALGSPGARAQRRPPADHKALREILGHCGRIGNNLNQIAYQLNKRGKPNIPMLTSELKSYKKIRFAIYTALNMNPSDDNKR